MNKVFIFMVLTCITFGSVFAEETIQNPNLPLLSNYSTNIDPNVNSESTGSNPLKKDGQVFVFASGLILDNMRGIMPGGGVVFRRGMLSVDATGYSFLFINGFTLSASPIFYFNSQKTRPYASLGIGIGGVRVDTCIGSFGGTGLILPLRFGVEHEHFFADVGAIGTGITDDHRLEVIPEIRFGYGF